MCVLGVGWGEGWREGAGRGKGGDAKEVGERNARVPWSQDNGSPRLLPWLPWFEGGVSPFCAKLRPFGCIARHAAIAGRSIRGFLKFYFIVVIVAVIVIVIILFDFY